MLHVESDLIHYHLLANLVFVANGLVNCNSMDVSVSNIPTTLSQHLFGIGNLDVLVYLDGPLKQINIWETPQTLLADIEVSLSLFINGQHYPCKSPELSL